MGPVLYEHGLELHPDHKLRFRLSAQVIAISQRGDTNVLWFKRSDIRPNFLLKACLDNIVQVITTRFFNNSWNEVPLFLKRHPVVWILVAERFLIQTIFLSHLTFDFRGYPRELVFHGRTSLRNVINHGLCKCSFKEGPVIFYSKVSWSWSKEVLCRIGHGLL